MISKKEIEEFDRDVKLQTKTYWYVSREEPIKEKNCYDKFFKGLNENLFCDHKDKPITGIMLENKYIAFVENGKIHRLNGPAVLTGSVYYYVYNGDVTNCNSLKEYNIYLKKLVFE